MHRLNMERIEEAAQLCTLVFKRNEPMLHHFMAAGITVDAGARLFSTWILGDKGSMCL